MRLILANQATAAKRRVYFQMVDGTDGITPETGEGTGQPQVSTNGGAFTSTGIGTLTHMGNGRYYAELTQTLVLTAGTIIETRYKSANTAEAVGDQVHVIGMDLDATTIPADTVALSGDTTAADNLEATYDGTGYTDPEAPSKQSQLDSLAITGSAINTPSTSNTLTTGSEDSGTYASTAALDGVLHMLSDTAGTLDNYYEFDVGADGVPVSCDMQGYLQGLNDSLVVQAWNWLTSSWDQVGDIAGQAGSGNIAYNFSLYTSHVGTGTDAGTVRIRFYDTGLTSAVFGVDQIFVSYAVVRRSIGYADGAIWVDTNASNTNTQLYVDGTADNPVSTWAAALTIAGASELNISRFRIAGGSTIQLSANSDYFALIGTEWNLQLNGQSIAGAHIEGALVSGISTGDNARFFHCKIGTSSLVSCGMMSCALVSELTLLSAGTYIMDSCFSAVAGTGSPTMDFGGAVAGTSLNLRHYSGGILIKNLGVSGTDNVSIEGDGQLKIDATCTGGTIAIRGAFKITDYASGAVTLSEEARFSMQQVADALKLAPTAGSPASGSVDEHLDSILSDTNAILVDTDAIDARLPADPSDESLQQAAHTQTQSDIAALNDPTADAISDAVWTETLADHSGTAGSTAEALGNATAPTAAVVADAVWDETLADHIAVGSTGAALDNVSPSGAIQITVQVNDQDTNGVPNAVVSVFDASNASFITETTADGNGLATIALATIGTYKARCVEAGYAFTVPETLAVAADNDSFTITATSYALDAAPDAQYCRVQTIAPLTDISGTLLAGYVIRFIASVPQSGQGGPLHARIVDATTDATGHFEVDLLRDTTVFVHAIEAGYDGTSKTVPDSASQDFADWS